MAGIRACNTRPELKLRRGLHRLGFRYRLHAKELPGRPDLVFPKYRAMLFVHGCFWHGHNCPAFRWPESRSEFWKEKIVRNRKRDREVQREIEREGWRCGIVWECALSGRYRLPEEAIFARCSRWLQSKSKVIELVGNYS